MSAKKLVSIAERKQFRICKMQKHKNTKLQKHKNAKKVLNQFSQLTKKTHIFCSEKSKKANPCIWAALPLAFSISYGQAKEMATHKGCHLPMYQALSSISGDNKIFRATRESIFFHFILLSVNILSRGIVKQENQ
ncbi:MAG: hypothetical protein IKY42_06385 [Bacteroidaceae bacterium]|nr:hypothetical protein [Bacteroidaceae bacterium]